MATYLVVEFKEEGEVAIVNKKWMVENSMDKVRWPNFRSPNTLKKAVTSGMDPQDSWRTFSVRVLYSSNSYEKARGKLRQAEDESDLHTVEEGEPRKRRPNRRYESSSDTSDQSDGSDSDSSTSSQEPTRATHVSARTSHARPPAPPPPPSPLVPPSPTPPSPPSSPVAAARNNNAFELRVVTLLLDIKAQVEHNTQLIIAERSKSSEPEEEAAEFPLKTLDDVDALEETLKDVTKQKHLVRQLSMIGGTNLATTVRRILTYCVAHELSMTFNWLGKGTGDKRAFSSLILKNVIFKAVQKNPLTASASLAQVESIIKSWFKHAADRNGGRQRRGNNE